MLEKIDPQNIDVYHDLYLTEFNLTDYDWMHYVFHARLTLPDNFIDMTLDYFGVITTQVAIKVFDYSGKILDECKFEVPTELFDTFRKNYLTEHIKSIGNEFAFCGHELAANLYNELMTIYIKKNDQ